MATRDRATTKADSGAPYAKVPQRYAREGSALEFDRVAFLSDAVYAIALTESGAAGSSLLRPGGADETRLG